jgi:hypothetical protein
MAFISFQPHDHFDVPTWTGSDSTTTVNGMDFKPDILWMKKYDGSSSPMCNNSSEGVAKSWKPSGDNAVDTTVYVASYTSDGFTLTGNLDDTNNNGSKYMAGCWKLNGATTASNTTGSINSTVQVNTTSGVSVVQWTGTGANGTIGHGLGVAPKFLVTKSTQTAARGLTMNMGTTFVSDPQTDVMTWGGGGAIEDDSAAFNDTAPTSSVFTIGTDAHHNASSQACMAYVFAEVKGFSKFGFYSGTGHVYGTKIYCGFRPKWVMIKSSSHANGDMINVVEGLTGYGLGGERKRSLIWSGNSHQDGISVQFESNGFRCASTDQDVNNENAIYWYMAFAEMPMVASNGVIALAT